MKKIIKFIPALTVSLIVFLILFLTLKDYGMHEDSPFHFLRGQAYLQEILTGEPQFKNIPKLNSPVLLSPNQRISTYKFNASEEINAPLRSVGIIGDDENTLQKNFIDLNNQLGTKNSFYKHNGWTVNYWDTIPNSHPAISDMNMAFFNRVFYEGFRVVGDVEGYHLYLIFVSILDIFFIFYFCQRVFGLRTAIFSTLSLVLYPFYFAESHFNIKDPVQMSFFTIAIISFYFWVTNNLSKKWYSIFIGAVFFALGTKWNIVFIPFIILPWILILRKNESIKKNLTASNLFFYCLLSIILPLGLLIATYPFLWTNTLTKLIDIFGFYSNLGVKDLRIEFPSFAPLPFGLDGQGIMLIYSMTPPLTLGLGLIGLMGLIGRKIKTEFKAEWLVFFWLLIPILRISWQGASIYGSMRNFMEFLPAMAILAGVGADLILARIHSGVIKIITVIIIIIYMAVLSFNLIRLHPNENLYFNSLVSGISEAKKAGTYNWTSNYDNVYRQVINWFNKNAPQKAKLAYLDGTMLSISPIWIRSDIRFGSYFSGFDQKGEYIISLIYPSPPAVFAYNYLDSFLDPIYEIKVDGVTIAKIWKNSLEKVKNGNKIYKIIDEEINIVKQKFENRKSWQINLNKSINLTRIILKVPSDNCNDNEVVWNIDDGYFVPQKLNKEGGKVEFDFAGNKAKTIKFFDVQENTCLYQSEIDSIYGL